MDNERAAKREICNERTSIALLISDLIVVANSVSQTFRLALSRIVGATALLPLVTVLPQQGGTSQYEINWFDEFGN